MNDIQDIPDFEEVPHKSDSALIVYGSSIDELFCHASLGMYQIMGITVKDFSIAQDIIELQASDPESLLVSFLSELLYIAENGFRAKLLEIRIKENELVARIIKTPITGIANEIKAVTFNEMKIIKQEETYQTKIVFDL